MVEVIDNNKKKHQHQQQQQQPDSTTADEYYNLEKDQNHKLHVPRSSHKFDRVFYLLHNINCIIIAAQIGACPKGHSAGLPDCHWLFKSASSIVLCMFSLLPLFWPVQYVRLNWRAQCAFGIIYLHCHMATPECTFYTKVNIWIFNNGITLFRSLTKRINDLIDKRMIIICHGLTDKINQ